MWRALLSLLGGPVIRGLIDAYKAKLAAENTQEKIAADLASGSLRLSSASANSHRSEHR